MMTLSSRFLAMHNGGAGKNNLCPFGQNPDRVPQQQKRGSAATRLTRDLNRLELSDQLIHQR
ncbi:MAG: hypothetical protein ACF8NJ_05025 [Phycisphaerales bacterium JB038]